MGHNVDAYSTCPAHGRTIPRQVAVGLWLLALAVSLGACDDGSTPGLDASADGIATPSLEVEQVDRPPTQCAALEFHLAVIERGFVTGLPATAFSYQLFPSSALSDGAAVAGMTVTNSCFEEASTPTGGRYYRVCVDGLTTDQDYELLVHVQTPTGTTQGTFFGTTACDLDASVSDGDDGSMMVPDVGPGADTGLDARHDVVVESGTIDSGSTDARSIDSGTDAEIDSSHPGDDAGIDAAGE